jgi:hypothetical protein
VSISSSLRFLRATASPRESSYFTLFDLISFPYHVRLPAAAVFLLAPRGPFPFHFGLDTIRWRWRYAIRRRWGDHAACGKEEGEKREAPALLV